MRIKDCACDLITKVNEAVNMAREAVKSISINGKNYTPDGTGKVILDVYKASEIVSTDGNVQTDIDALKTEDTNLASDIADNATAIANEVTARTDADNTLQTAIDEINGSISTNATNIASNKTEIDANATAIANEITARQNADDSIQSTLNDTITGDTTANVIYHQQTNDDTTTDYAQIQPMKIDGTRASDWLYAIAVQGKGISLENSTGNNLNLSVKDAPASEINLTDGRDVDTAITSIDDEIGSEDSSGSILARIKANETAITEETTARQNEDTELANSIADNATAIADNATAIAGKQDVLTAGDGISIANNVISNTLDISGIATNATAITAEITNRENADDDIKASAISRTTLGGPFEDDNSRKYFNWQLYKLNGTILGSEPALTVGDGLEISNTYLVRNGNTSTYPTISNTGVTSIIAGDNITVDNSTGAVTISATGGTEYTAGNRITITDNTINVTPAILVAPIISVNLGLDAYSEYIASTANDESSNVTGWGTRYNIVLGTAGRTTITLREDTDKSGTDNATYTKTITRENMTTLINMMFNRRNISCAGRTARYTVRFGGAISAVSDYYAHTANIATVTVTYTATGDVSNITTTAIGTSDFAFLTSAETNWWCIFYAYAMT